MIFDMCCKWMGLNLSLVFGIAALALSVAMAYAAIRRLSYPLWAFRDCAKFYSISTGTQFEFVNLGSTAGVWAFDWDGAEVSGGNFAMESQSATYDFALLRKFERFLAPQAVVIMTFSPFSSLCSKDYPLPNRCSFAKYYGLLRDEEMTYHSDVERFRVWLSLHLAKPGWRKWLEASRPRLQEKSSPQKRKETVQSLRRLWMARFGQSVFCAGCISPGLKKDWDWNVNTYQQMVDWCVYRGYRPVFVLPPLASEFDTLLSESFYSTYVFDFIEKVNRPRVPFLNYISDEQFRGNQDVYFDDALRLSYEGRSLFTRIVIDRLKSMEGFEGGNAL